MGLLEDFLKNQFKAEFKDHPKVIVIGAPSGKSSIVDRLHEKGINNVLVIDHELNLTPEAIADMIERQKNLSFEPGFDNTGKMIEVSLVQKPFSPVAIPMVKIVDAPFDGKSQRNIRREKGRNKKK